MIKHIHLDKCDSTQDELKEQLNNPDHPEQILVSTENQTSGRGRGEKKWEALPGSLCFSLNIRPHKELSFTALELSVILAKFFEAKGQSLKLKWPNDLWDSNLKKCAGILVQGAQSNLLAGIGLNLFSDNSDYGGIFPTSFDLDKKAWSKDIADFILKNRYTDTTLLKKDWLIRCGHLNQMVKIIEGSQITEGIFQGIGQHGEAEVCTDSKINHIYNGSLRIS